MRGILPRRIGLGRIGTGSTALDGFLAAIVVAAITLFIAMSVTGPLGSGHRSRFPQASTHVVPPDAVPEVEPIKFQSLAPADARAFNMAVPFSTEPNPAARPFAFVGGPDDRLRALDCLAAAVLYEAGDDPVGQRAVAQVVLNRVRHPAFPRTVCGVVFQGSERRTGCQFTFTCDGALTRSYSDAAWERARGAAEAALSGSVYKPVGQATHYHTDWVVPYWSASLDKIVAIHTHLFFRWTGWWGTPPAFRFRATGIEPRIAQLALRFPEHAQAGTDPLALRADAPAGMAPAAITSGVIKPTQANPDAFQVLLAPRDAAGFAEIAAFTCGARPRCKFMGWTDPANLPASGSVKLTPEQLAATSFSYLRDRSINMERALWNCGEFKRPAAQCMWSKSPAPAAKPLPLPSATPSAAPIKTLDGVRFKAEPRPGDKS